MFSLLKTEEILLYILYSSSIYIFDEVCIN
jgi:hypothetical protein